MFHVLPKKKKKEKKKIYVFYVKILMWITF